MIKYFYLKGSESGFKKVELKNFNIKHHRIIRNYIQKKFNYDVVVLIYAD